jgi:hypothetical protein
MIVRALRKGWKENWGLLCALGQLTAQLLGSRVASEKTPWGVVKNEECL